MEYRLYSPPINKATIGEELRGIAKRQGKGCGHVVVGIPNDNAKEAMKGTKPWLYIDHSYFKRGWGAGNFRVTRNNVHLTHIVPRPDDRLKMWEVEIEPWKKKGTEIVIIPPSEQQARLYDCEDWVMKTETKLAQITDRPVTVKVKKMVRLSDFCKDTWAVVTYASVAGVEAALMGIPVFSTPNCPSWPITAGDLENIETPVYAENRHEWACSLAYASWNTREIRRVKWGDYDYGPIFKDDLCA